MNGTKQLLYVSATVEALTGIVAIVSPSIVVWLLWAIPLTVGGRLVGRMAGFALVGLAIACWPSRNVRNEAAPIRALLVYNVLTTAFFLSIAIRTPFVGVLLWPAVVFHFVMSVLFVLAWKKNRTSAPPTSL